MNGPSEARSAATGRAGGRSPGGSALGKPITQVAMVVPDLDRAMATWWDGLGIGPWHVYTLGAPTMARMVYRGRETSFRIRLALAFSGSMMLELVEPLEGESIWHETLAAAGGASFQHVAVYVEDHDASVAEVQHRGWRPVQSGSGFGRSRDGAFTYLEHDLGRGVIVEVVQAPTQRFGPERIHPAPDGG